MIFDALNVAEEIIARNWPSQLSDVQILEVINNIPLALSSRDMEYEDLNSDIFHNIALWIGGIPKDLQVYAWQLIRRVKNFTVYSSSETYVRLYPLEEKVFSFEPYEAFKLEDIVKFKWPREFSNTFEERLAELVDSIDEQEVHELLTADLVLTGQHREPVEDIAKAYALIVACVGWLKDYQASNNLESKLSKLIYSEKLQCFYEWLEFQSVDLKAFGEGLIPKE